MIEVAAFHIDVPEDLVAVLVEDGFIAECSKHGFEVAAGKSPQDLEDELDRLAGKDDWATKHEDSPSLQDVTSDELLALDAEASEW